MHLKQAKGLSTEAANGPKEMLADYEGPYRDGQISLEDWKVIHISHAMCLKDQVRYNNSMRGLEYAMRNLLQKSSSNTGSTTTRSLAVHSLFQAIGLLRMNPGHHSEAHEIFQCIAKGPARVLALAALVSPPIKQGYVMTKMMTMWPSLVNWRRSFSTQICVSAHHWLNKRSMRRQQSSLTRCREMSIIGQS